MADADPPRLTAFRAEGILGGLSYHLDISQSASIIVGPNGTGKSTFLSIFYLFLSRQWNRLVEYDFTLLTLFYVGGEISISKTDMQSLDALPRTSPRIRNYINVLAEAGHLDVMLKSNLNRTDRDEVSRLLSVPPSEVILVKRYLEREIPFSAGAFSVDNKLQALGFGRILYMPTYRRIEKDIKSIFPDIEDRIRVRIQENQITAREGVNFQEIVSFGMEDIAKIIKVFTDSVKDFQRVSTETASQEYIRDIVRGRVTNYSLKGVRDLDDNTVSDFISRLDVNLFTEKDRISLSEQIERIRRRQPGQPNKDMRYLGFFVEKLLAAHLRVKEQEEPLLRFGRYVSSYLGKNKVVSFRNLAFQIQDSETGKDIALEKLSSGEKQILSIFAYLLLRREKGYILFIDEPELSLSVPWQKTFLPNLLETNSCQYLFAVTHSPFVFDNYLKKNVIDVSRLQA